MAKTKKGHGNAVGL